jgi:hypothetical protein
MATSGTTTFSITRNDLISASLRGLGVLEESAQPTANMIENASLVLNMMLKDWMTDGIKMWTVEEYTIPLKTNQTDYTIGPSSSYDVNKSKPLRVIQAFLRNLGQPTNAVGKVSLLSGGTNYTVQPTNPVSVTGGTGTGATFNLTYTGTTVSSISLQAAGSGYSVGDVLTVQGGTFTTPATITVTSLSNTYVDQPLIIVSQQEYNFLGSKFTTGTSNSIQYWPYVDYGTLKIFLTPDVNTANNYEVHLTVQRAIYDINKSNETFDFPQEWYQALRWGLASELILDYGVPEQKSVLITQRAQMYKERLAAWDTENASTMFQPDMRMASSRFR